MIYLYKEPRDKPAVRFLKEILNTIAYSYVEGTNAEYWTATNELKYKAIKTEKKIPAIKRFI